MGTFVDSVRPKIMTILKDEKAVSHMNNYENGSAFCLLISVGKILEGILPQNTTEKGTETD